MNNNTYQKYKQQSILTASPGDLTLMLYDGCIKQLNFAIKYIEEDNITLKNTSYQKAEAIISELMTTLNMNYALSENLFSIYDYIYRLLVLSNVTNDISKVHEALEMITEIRNTWEIAIKTDRKSMFNSDSEGINYDGK